MDLPAPMPTPGKGGSPPCQAHVGACWRETFAGTATDTHWRAVVHSEIHPSGSARHRSSNCNAPSALLQHAVQPHLGDCTISTKIQRLHGWVEASPPSSNVERHPKGRRHGGDPASQLEAIGRLFWLGGGGHLPIVSKVDPDKAANYFIQIPRYLDNWRHLAPSAILSVSTS